MTAEERCALLDQVETALQQLRDVLYGPDGNEGKVVWPPQEDMSRADALATLFDIQDCDLDLTLYDDTGMEITDEWAVTFSGTRLYPNSPGRYARKPLKAMIEEELAIYVSEETEDCRPARLLARLLAAFDEPPP
jgi:hypothetical protein